MELNGVGYSGGTRTLNIVGLAKIGLEESGLSGLVGPIIIEPGFVCTSLI